MMYNRGHGQLFRAWSAACRSMPSLTRSINSRL